MIVDGEFYFRRPKQDYIPKHISLEKDLYRRFEIFRGTQIANGNNLSRSECMRYLIDEGLKR